MCPACMVQWLFCKPPVLPAGNPPKPPVSLDALVRPRTDFALVPFVKFPCATMAPVIANNRNNWRHTSSLHHPPDFSNVACSLRVCSWVQAKLRTHLDHAPPDLVAPVPRRSGPPWTNRSPVPPIRAWRARPGLGVVFAFRTQAKLVSPALLPLKRR